jgi:hypothetical protein
LTQGADQRPLDDEAGPGPERDREDEGQPPVEPRVEGPLRHQQGGEGAHLRVGEVEEAVRLEDEHETDRKQADRQPVHDAQHQRAGTHAEPPRATDNPM